MNHDHSPNETPFWRSRSTWAFLGFFAIAGFFLFTEHRAHVFVALPFILLALCPLLHIFGHSGHGDHGAPSGETKRGGGHEH
jgi:cell division protein FtsW (lipid II flippase)